MLSMRIDTMVAALVQQLLLEEGGREEALHFHFDLGLSHYTNAKSYEQRRGLHLLYQVNPGYTYVNVFSAVLPSSFAPIEKVETWTHECTHDSCWANINVFSKTYFDMAMQINGELADNGLCRIPPRDMSEHNNSRLWNKMYDWQKVLIAKDPSDKNNYRKLVKLVKE